MRSTAIFSIDGCFILDEKGLVIYGEILRGEINSGNYINIDAEGQIINLRIKGIEYVDFNNDQTAKTGLTFYYDTEEEKEKIKTLYIAKQEVLITGNR